MKINPNKTIFYFAKAVDGKKVSFSTGLKKRCIPFLSDSVQNIPRGVKPKN